MYRQSSIDLVHLAYSALHVHCDTCYVYTQCFYLGLLYYIYMYIGPAYSFTRAYPQLTNIREVKRKFEDIDMMSTNGVL